MSDPKPDTILSVKPDDAEHPVSQAWLRPRQGVLARIAARMQSRGAHPARTVVLLPYAQLMPVAARLWTQAFAHGFAPRFETTQNWSRSLGGFTPTATDITFDAGLDALTAQAMIERAGLSGAPDALATGLVQAAHQLGALAAAVPPAQRARWVEQAGAAAGSGMSGEALALEAALAQLAVVWAAHSSYATDVLFTSEVVKRTDCLIVLQGFQPEPWMASLQSVWGERMSMITLDDEAAAAASVPGFHAARDAQDEAQRAAACVLQHVNAGRTPVALVVTDRSLTRRVRAMLAASGLALRDETGWKLSTSRAGAHVMGALRACVWNASSDSVLDWLKNAPAFDGAAVRAIEAHLRRKPEREWRALAGHDMQQPALAALLGEVELQRDAMQRSRTLAQWLTALRELLQHSGQWALLQDDVAGDKLVAVLRLSPAASNTEVFAQALWAARRLSLSEFIRWVNQALEGASFTPEYPRQEQVVILPLAQMLGRPFAAVVVPGCDEVRLNPSPEPPGLWSAAQREALGLPSRAALEAELRAAWLHALQTPYVDLLWRSSDEGGEPLLPSALVQALRLSAGNAGARASDPRAQRRVIPAPLSRPAPQAPALSVEKLSASAYSDLRQCPYRFFAQRMLGLKEAEELEAELDKRDFGLWLHAVLKAFHDRLKSSGAQDVPTRLTLMDAAVDEVNRSLQLAQEEFLPFMAAWPRVRAGYLEWLGQHEASGARFAEAERWQAQPVGPVTLVGRLDRIDQTPDGAMVIDYKTESTGVTRERIKEPFEDTQLAFYAALLPHDTLHAAYVNVGERDGTQLFEQKDVVAVRDALIEGIVHDMTQIAQGAALPALGEGTVCEFCAARGLCRKDFWTL